MFKRTTPMPAATLFAAFLSLQFAMGADAPADAPGLSAEEAAQMQRIMAAMKKINPQTGNVPIGSGLATVKVPENLRYLDPASASALLVDIWGNPPGQDTLGMLIPAAVSPLDEASWGVVLTFDEEGYVKDDDAAGINYDDLLQEMKTGTTRASEQRKKQGFQGIELVGWATPPHYDAAAKKLYWAKELRFEGSAKNTLNYNIRVLGRRGVLNLNVVGGMEQLAQIEADAPGILAAVDFNAGNRYADFNPTTDHVAEYGIAALIAGGIAAKTGLLKGLWIAILAGKKFIILGVAALGAWISKLVKGRKQTAFHETPPPA